MRKNAPADRFTTPVSSFARSFEPSWGLPPARPPRWPAGGYGLFGRAAALAETGSASTPDLQTARMGTEGGAAQTGPAGVSSPTTRGVAGGRPQMAYHHINLARR